MAAEEIRKYSMIPERKTQQTPSPKKQRFVKKAWFTKGEKLLYTSGLVIIAISMIFVVQYSSNVDSVNRDLQKVNSNIEQVKTENNALHAEVKEMSKPSRILAEAEKHGLTIKNANVKQASQTN
ncbi:cell division protein FtsL [Piscibacillus halophilus]|uniref:Cell division protein FtsL n=1 Tax=Piscibacillus halophilus TaxID=571933 RepID=A0A1H8YSG3_9BACI|nr:cell division protein FtsL [Piscibacillus halophilus]SEP55164.1 cell division protein FtsL [Piscibacillus halophilus]